jgi:hypothetical protein
MARPQVAVGRDGLQIWRVAANILNKQSRTADRWRSYSFGVGPGLTTPTIKNCTCYEIFTYVSELDGFSGTTYLVGSG